MDNLTFHKVEIIAPLLDAVGAKVLYLSPYSLEFNPTEHWWSQLKAFLRQFLTNDPKNGRYAPCNSILKPYKAYLREQWHAGQCQTQPLFEAICQQGYQGTYKTVAKYTHQLRQAQRQQLSALEGRGLAPTNGLKQPPLSARRATWPVLKPLQQRSDEDESLRLKLQQHPTLAAAIDLAQQFAELVRQRLPQPLDRWLEQASTSSIKQFQNFAQSLQEDYEAVKAGVTLAVSNGQVEGQINRLKMLKRQMYGRAGFDLLQKRVILAG